MTDAEPFCEVTSSGGTRCAPFSEIHEHASVSRDAFFDPETVNIPVMVSYDSSSNADATEALYVYAHSGLGRTTTVGLDAASRNDQASTCKVCLFAQKRVGTTWTTFMPSDGTATLTVPDKLGDPFTVELRDVILREIAGQLGGTQSQDVVNGSHWWITSTSLSGTATWYHCDLVHHLFGGSGIPWVDGGRYCMHPTGAPSTYSIWGCDDLDGDSAIELHDVEDCTNPTPRCTQTADTMGVCCP